MGYKAISRHPISPIRSTSLVFACCLALSACSAQTPDTNLQVAAAASEHESSSSSKPPPTPQGVSKQEFLVERSLGARCPGSDDTYNAEYHVADLGTSVCIGLLPEDFRRAIVALPLDELGLSREAREAAVGRETWLRAISGQGEEPDFIVGFEEGWIRSFEDVAPGTTAYLVRGPYCKTPPDTALGCGALDDLRMYVVGPNGRARDLTQALLPASPALSSADRARYLEEHGATGMFRDDSRFTSVPVMRMYVELDPDRLLPASDPRSFGYAHLGFLVWNGQRFEVRDKVPRSLWPCTPVPAGVQACSRDPRGDRFVTGGP